MKMSDLTIKVDIGRYEIIDAVMGLIIYGGNSERDIEDTVEWIWRRMDVETHLREALVETINYLVDTEYNVESDGNEDENGNSGEVIFSGCMELIEDVYNRHKIDEREDVESIIMVARGFVELLPDELDVEEILTDNLVSFTKDVDTFTLVF